jgi:hypothetical protein
MAVPPAQTLLTIPLVGAGGEAVSLRGTLRSHGLAWLPPNDMIGSHTLRTTLLARDGTARTIDLFESAPGQLGVTIAGRPPNAQVRADVAQAARAMLALDDDLRPFYRSLGVDPEFAFVHETGIGRFLRSPTAFEDLVRTLSTTNCAWSATERMVGAFVTHLGTRTAQARGGSWHGRAFPSAAIMAAAPEDFYRDVARAGYRGAYFRALAEMVASGEIDVEAWRSAPRSELPTSNWKNVCSRYRESDRMRPRIR